MTASDTLSHAFSDVTEMPGEEISGEQLQRICNRYYWAGDYSDGKDVVEIACGAGAGLGYLASRARSVRACDIDDAVLAAPRAHYGSRVEILTADASETPYEDNSADVVMLFEAIYYLPDAREFLADAKRILRPGGVVLVATANKDLYDFNPSPFSHVYYGVVELAALAAESGFETIETAGCTSVRSVSWRQRILRPIKKIVVGLNLMPKTMGGKKLLKRLIFGSMVRAPAEIDSNTRPYEKPTPIPADRPNRDFKVILFSAKKPAA